MAVIQCRDGEQRPTSAYDDGQQNSEVPEGDESALAGLRFHIRHLVILPLTSLDNPQEVPHDVVCKHTDDDESAEPKEPASRRRVNEVLELGGEDRGEKQGQGKVQD